MTVLWMFAALQFEPDGSVTAMQSEEGEKVTFVK
jgi:hypothetical protein